MKILLFGASGQLGSEILKHATDIHQVLVPTSKELPIELTSEVAKILDVEQPDLVINAAAYTDVESAEEDSEKADLINHLAVKNLAQACGESTIPLIHFSTDYVFDGKATEQYTEGSQTNPISVYGATKLAGERAIQANCPAHLILRVSWLFGVQGRNFVKTVLRLGETKDKLTIVADQFGRPTSASSVARLSLKMGEQLVSGVIKPGVYHYGNQPATNWYGFAREIVKQAREVGIMRSDCQVTPIASEDYPTKAQRPLNSILDCGKIRAASQIDLEDWQKELRDVLLQLKPVR